MRNYLITIYFAALLASGLLIIGDYGATLDDEIYYNNGLNTYIYVKAVLNVFGDTDNIAKLKQSLDLHPVVFETFVLFICDLLKINEINEILYTSHIINYVLFIISLICLYKIINIRFNNKKIALISSLLVIFTPRIFFESFYNTRDIYFMSLFIFYLYFLYNYLNNKNIKNLIIFSLLSALLINSKILGIIPVFIYLIIYVFNCIDEKRKIRTNINNLLIFIIFTLVFIYIFWPYLWENPIFKIYYAFNEILKSHEELVIINYYFGEHISSKLTPWHYRIIWFLITTPIIIILLFLFGIMLITKKYLIKFYNIDKKKKFKINKNEFYDLFILLNFIIILFSTVYLNTSKFGGWRHLYFLYPLIIYFSAYFMQKIIINKIGINFFKLIIICLGLNISYIGIWVIKNHPNQYIYFNVLTKNYTINNFDLDWWGVSHFNTIKKILNDDKSDKITIFARGFTELKPTLMLLKKELRERVILTNYENSEYILDNNMRRIRGNIIIDKNKYKPYMETKVDGVIINRVYKKVN